jgi:hypothetical protein
VLKKVDVFVLSFTQQDKQGPSQLFEESERFSPAFFLLSQPQTT